MRCLPLLRLCTFISALLFLVAAQARAASAPTGIVIGRVFNPATGEYVRNAQIRVGNNPAVISEGDGSFRITDVPAGDATVVVSYTGYQDASATVPVRAGETATQNFNITSSLQRAATPDGAPIRLGEFVVSSERDGAAKAIMNQRNSMDQTNSVASDTFGDQAEGNVGEFVKNIPGVELEMVEGVARNFRLRGLGAEYASVTLDGVSLASADGNTGAAGDARAFSFEQVSMSSMEAIEISKTISADSEANAPAGTVNLRTKRAFDREGRRITWQANVTAFADQFSLNENVGPDDTRRRRVLPGGIFEFSDVFFNKRLGVILNVSESNLYSENNSSSATFNFTPTAADPRPAVITAVNVRHGPRTNERFTTTLTTDFKATPRLVLSLGFIYNYSLLNYVMRNYGFNTGARNTVVGADPLLDFTSSNIGTVTQTGTMAVKLGRTISYTPKFEYRIGNLTLDGRIAHSTSISTYEPIDDYGAVRNANSGALAGATFRATRSSLGRHDWQITQLAGPDWADGTNYRNPIAIVDDGRYARTFLFSSQLDATLKTRTGWPIVWKAGVKRKEEYRKFEVFREALNYAYDGPGGGATGSWGAFASPKAVDLSMVDTRITSVSGAGIFTPNFQQIGRLYMERPEYFSHRMTAANYYQAYVANKRAYEETIDNAYFMGTTNVRKLQLRGGLRWEETTTDSLEFDPRTPKEVRDAGYQLGGNGVATSIPGVQYQYLSQPRVHRIGSYDNLFPSASAKYSFSDRLQFHAGYSSTIRRPTFRDIAGVWIINEIAQTVNAPNPQLRPEMSDNYSARLAYYFEPVGTLAINVFENHVAGAAISTEQTAEEFGYTEDPELAAYTFISAVSRNEKTIIRGMELEFSQSLSFLPAPFNGLGVYANYSRNYASVLYTNMVPHSVKAGFSYSHRKFAFNTSLTWADTVATNATGGFRRHRTVVNGGGSYRLSDRTSVFFTVQNLTDSPHINEQVREGIPTLATSYSSFGAIWTFGIKGRF